MKASEHYLKLELYSWIQTDSALFEFLEAGSLDGIWYRDLENPSQEWMSPRFKEVFGYRDDEVPNTSDWWQQNIFPEDLAVALDNVNKHCADPNHPFDQIVRYRHKNGSTVWVRCRGMAIRDAAGKPIRMLGVHADVTAIKRTQERIEALYEAAPDMYIEADLETAVISDCNHALLETMGHGNIVGTTFLELCDAESVPKAESVLYTLRSQAGMRNLELSLRRANGSAVPVLLAAHSTQDAETGRKLLRAWCRDISHLKRFANVEVLMAALPGGIVLADEGDEISYVNPAAEQMFSYKKGELLGKPWRNLLAGEVQPDQFALDASADLRGVRKDNSVFPIAVQWSALLLGEGAFKIMTITDLTSRQSIESDLRESEHRFRQLTESLPAVVWTCTPEGVCDYLSPQWVKYTGIPEAAQLNLGWLEQIHPDDRDAIVAEWSSSVKTGEPFRFEYRIRRDDGEYRWFEGRGIPLRNVEKQIVKWFGSSSDVHEARETRVALELERHRLANLIALAPAVFCSFCLRTDGSSYFPFATADTIDLLGVHPDDLKQDANHIFKRFHADDLGPVQASIAASAETMSTWRADFRIVHPEKGERWIEGHSTPALEKDGSCIWHGFLADITERKRVEADQQFLLRLGAEMQAAGSTVNIPELATKLVGDYFDAARCSLSTISVPRNEATRLHEHTRRGYSPAPSAVYPLTMWGDAQWLAVLASGTSVAVADTASDPITAPFYQNAFRSVDIAALIAVPLRREGQWVAVLTLTVPEQRHWLQREIDLARAAAERIWPAYETARAHAAERAMHETLAASEERLRLALQSADIGIWEQNRLNGENHWDTRSKSIFGFAPSWNVSTDEAMARIHAEDREEVIARAQSFLDPEGNGRFEMEYRVHALDEGSLRYVYGQGQTFFEGEGANRRAVRSVGTLQDVTAQRQRERDLRRANEDLEQFAYAAAHDLKAPLRVIDNASRWLEEDLQKHLSDDTRANMKLLRGRVRRLEKLLDDLLEYACIGRAMDERYAEMIAGNVMMEDIVTLLSPQGFKVVVNPDLARIQVYRMPLQQILMNLIGNAIKHHDKKNGTIEVTVEDDGAHYAFAVKDDGPGIPARFHEQIFKMFQTLRPKDQVEGSGMGLAMVRKNIEVFGGAMQLESAEGKGSIFRFTWPKQQQLTGENA